VATVRVLYFGGLRDAVGLSEELIVLPAHACTVADVRALVAGRHRAYAEGADCVRVARNEAFADDGEAVVEGDVIALMPPMAGG
jgi:molybdopterin converting factor subunit 1